MLKVCTCFCHVQLNSAHSLYGLPDGYSCGQVQSAKVVGKLRNSSNAALSQFCGNSANSNYLADSSII